MSSERTKSAEDDLFRTLVTQAPDSLTVVAPNGTLRYSNPQFCSALGYRRAELAARTLFELIHEDDRARIVARFDRELRIPGAQVSFRTRLHHSDGSWRPFDAVARAMSGEAEGAILSLREDARVAGGRPMTRRAMDEVSGYVSTSPDGRILACNPAFIRVFGFESEERVKDADFWNLFPQSDVSDKLRTMLSDLGRVENFEVRGLKQDASEIYLLMNLASRVGHDGKLEGLEAQILDITEKRKLEERWRRAQRMEAMGQLACGVAHDFNNLLTAILGYTEILQGSINAQSPYQVKLGQVREAGLKAASLTRQLLTFGKGKVVEIEVIQLNDVVEDVQPLLAQLAGINVEIVLELSSGLDPLKIDRSQLEQVIMNLALNAKDAMDGAGRLTIQTSNHRVEQPFVLHHDSVRPGDYTMLAMRDTGCGIEPEIMEHLFEPFFTTKETGKGTGLGLSTVYGIVKQNGGFISVYNEPTGGVTFKVSFPSVQDVEETRPQAEARPAASSRETLTVLVAEDDDAVRSLVESALQSAGFKTLVAIDGLDALELARSHRGAIDLLVTDISMPRLDGIGLARRFSAERPSVPILLISGTANTESLAFDSKDRVEFLEKPFTPSKLLERLHTML